MTSVLSHLLMAFMLPVVASSLGMAAEMTVQFGEMIKGKDGGDIVREAKAMSLKESLSYGWMAHSKTANGKITYKETLKIPSKGYNFNGVAVTPAKTDFITTKEVDVVNGYFGHKWRPSRDDPGGEYAITVTVEGNVILDIKFFMLPP
jgi:hypothetical protein